MDLSGIMGFLNRIKRKQDSDSTNSKNFRYLNKILSKHVQTIELNQDIVFSGMDHMSFSIEWGCSIMDKEITFEGNGHKIDGKGNSTIFDIMGSKCVFKNVNFMNGHYSDLVNLHGGFIISVGSDVEFINCRFENFQSNKGTFYNFGNLTFKHCKFINNSATDVGGAINNQITGKVNIIDCEFVKNDSKNGGAIYNMGQMIIKDSIFCQNNSQKNGGAIFNQSSNMSLENCKFRQNKAKFGGVIVSFGGSHTYQRSIYADASKGSQLIQARAFRVFEQDVTHNSSEVNFESCKFDDNEADEGIINIQKGSKFFFDDCTFKNSKGSGIISNWDELEVVNSISCENYTNFLFNNGNAKFRQCKFIQNDNGQRIDVINNSSLDLIDCAFDNNNMVSIISNKKDGECHILGGKVSNNTFKETALFNDGLYFSISKTIFENNISGFDFADDIYNNAILNLHQPVFKGESKQRVFNKGNIEIRDFSKKDVETFIKDEGNIEFFKLEADLNEDMQSSENVISNDEENGLDFVDLDNLIQEHENIVLNDDFTLKNFELDFYEGGILLDKDNLTIDGNNHTIDANGRSCIFHVTGNNITLKNIRFKNGNFKTRFDKSISGGGTMRIINGASVNLIHCTFEESESEYNGGAIFNRGKLTSSESSYVQNSSNHGGGVIFNKGDYLSEFDVFDGNSSNLGSAIYNEGLSNIVNPNFKDAISAISSSKQIFNSNQMKIDLSYLDYILNVGDINKDLSIPPKSFEDLFIIFNINPKSVVLNEDIVYTPTKDKDINKILIDKKDGFVIDGNGFSIDAKNQPIALKIYHTKKEILFRNITFKNFNCIGSMIENEARIIFENCKFTNNKSIEGNIIENLHMVKFYKCVFLNNSCSKNIIENDARYYSVLIEKNTLEMHYCIFLENNLKGTILLNKHKMNIEDSIFTFNHFNEAMILNVKETIVKKTHFLNNISDGVMIKNRGEGQLMIFDSKFKENEFDISIFTAGSSEFSSIDSSKFIKNISERGSMFIIDKNSYMGISYCEFKENSSNGPIISKNNGRFRIQNSKFIKNVPNQNRSMIDNNFVLDLENNTFTDNTINKGYIIENKNGAYLNQSENVFNESSDNIIHEK